MPLATQAKVAMRVLGRFSCLTLRSRLLWHVQKSMFSQYCFAQLGGRHQTAYSILGHQHRPKTRMVELHSVSFRGTQTEGIRLMAPVIVTFCAHHPQSFMHVMANECDDGVLRDLSMLEKLPRTRPGTVRPFLSRSGLLLLRHSREPRMEHHLLVTGYF